MISGLSMIGNDRDKVSFYRIAFDQGILSALQSAILLFQTASQVVKIPMNRKDFDFFDFFTQKLGIIGRFLSRQRIMAGSQPFSDGILMLWSGNPDCCDRFWGLPGSWQKFPSSGFLCTFADL